MNAHWSNIALYILLMNIELETTVRSQAGVHASRACWHARLNIPRDGV